MKLKMTTDNERIRTLILDTEKLLSETFKGKNLSVSEDREIKSILGQIKVLRDTCSELKLGPEAVEEDFYDIAGETTTPQIPYEVTPTTPTVTTTSKESVPPTEADSGDDEEYYDGNAVVLITRSVAEFQDPPRKGFLKVKGSGLLSGYSSKFCVAAESLLFIYDKETSKRQANTIILKGYEARHIESKKKSKDTKFDFELVKPACRTHFFRAADEDDLKKWIYVLNKQSKFNPRPGVVSRKSREPKKKDKDQDVAEKNKINAHKQLPPVPTEEEGELYDDASSSQVEPEPIDEELYEVTEDQRPPPLAAKSSTKASSPAKRPLPPPVDNVEEDDEIYDEATSGAVEPDNESPVPPPEPPRKDIIRKTQLSKRVQPSGNFDNARGIIQDTDGVEFGGFYYCKYDNFSGGSNELKFNRGEIVFVFSSDYAEQGWLLAEMDGNKGLIPKTYLEPAYEVMS